ncbi:MAG: phosphatidate cytidylyltransferase [Ectothiorhodospiraceae bacterium]|nr:phosphatidate cytidylyltransferase [Ectothiorhodospiraceae bacterium]MCH8504537.1 phosphatidate cytidylyltransferase [Ectothiorhodospiraceae bacterium]
MLRWRVLTALVLLPLALAAIFLLPTWGFAMAAGAAFLVGAWEWTRLVGCDRPATRWAYLGGLVFIMGVIGGAPADGPWSPLLLLLGLLWWLVALVQLKHYASATEEQRGAATPAPLLTGALVLLPSWCGMVWLHAQPAGPWLLLFPLVLTWAADVGAYFAGRALGRRKLAPGISPGKTWEGAIGGLLLAVVAALVMETLFPVPPMSVVLLIPIVLLTVVFSVVGDLYESMVKRRVGVKDSGTLLPGHGGVLDRIDSLTASVTIFALLLYLIGMMGL